MFEMSELKLKCKKMKFDCTWYFSQLQESSGGKLCETLRLQWCWIDVCSAVHEQAQKQGIKALLENKSKFLACHSSSGHKHSLKDVLSDPAVALRLENTKAAAEVKALNEFFKMMNTDPGMQQHFPSNYGSTPLQPRGSCHDIKISVILCNFSHIGNPACAWRAGTAVLLVYDLMLVPRFGDPLRFRFNSYPVFCSDHSIRLTWFVQIVLHTENNTCWKPTLLERLQFSSYRTTVSAHTTNQHI